MATSMVRSGIPSPRYSGAVRRQEKKRTNNTTDAAMHEAVPAIASCGASPIVRVPDMQEWLIKREHYELPHASHTRGPRGASC